MSSDPFSNDYGNSGNYNNREERTPNTTNNNSEPVKCPQCKSKNIISIVYGYPGPELFEQSERGEVMLGGCCVFGDEPHHHCKNCGMNFK